MPYDNPAEKETITITGIESKAMKFGTKTIIKTEDKKYIFFDKKMDGSESTASKQFRELGIGVGRTISVGYSSTDKIYSKGGQDIPYEERRILYFDTQAEKRPPTKTGMQPANFEQRILNIEAQLREHECIFAEVNKQLKTMHRPVELKDTIIDEVPPGL